MGACLGLRSAALTGGCRALFARADWYAASSHTGRVAVGEGGRVAVALRRVASRVLGRVSAPGAVVAQWMQDTQRSNAERPWRLSPEFGEMSAESAISATQPSFPSFLNFVELCHMSILIIVT